MSWLSHDDIARVKALWSSRREHGEDDGRRRSISRLRRPLRPLPTASPHHAPAIVVFVHGLGGGSCSTWMAAKDAPGSGPSWLAADFPNLGVWTLGYQADVSAWTSESMPLADRGTAILETLANEGIGDRPVVFITHSMGGDSRQADPAACDELWRRAMGVDCPQDVRHRVPRHAACRRRPCRLRRACAPRAPDQRAGRRAARASSAPARAARLVPQLSGRPEVRVPDLLRNA